jgi:hypothetical protein
MQIGLQWAKNRAISTLEKSSRVRRLPRAARTPAPLPPPEAGEAMGGKVAAQPIHVPLAPAGSSKGEDVQAPERFAAWLTGHEHIDPRFGHVYRYHSRSDAHSVALCQYVMEDLIETCPMLGAEARAGEVAYGINLSFQFPSGKVKNLDLAVGVPVQPVLPVGGAVARVAQLVDLRLAMEAKSVMTEHGKSQPRVFDELSSSHEIVHHGGQEILAAGITVVNIADRFVSPLRQNGPDLHWSLHKQPGVTASMVRHLRGLPIRDREGEVGFDAYATIVICCDNQTDASVWTAPPAPQPGERDHYGTFLARLSEAYARRFR